MQNFNFNGGEASPPFAVLQAPPLAITGAIVRASSLGGSSFLLVEITRSFAVKALTFVGDAVTMKRSRSLFAGDEKRRAKWLKILFMTFMKGRS